MNDFPLQRIPDFIRTVVPFDTLSEEALNQVVGEMEIGYYPRGEIIIRRGDNPPNHLNIIQLGSPRIEKGRSGILRDLIRAGAVF